MCTPVVFFFPPDLVNARNDRSNRSDKRLRIFFFSFIDVYLFPSILPAETLSGVRTSSVANAKTTVMIITTICEFHIADGDNILRWKTVEIERLGKGSAVSAFLQTEICT